MRKGRWRCKVNRGGAEYLQNEKAEGEGEESENDPQRHGNDQAACLQSGALKVQRGEKPDFCSSAFFFVLPALLPSPPSPPSFSNFPEDGGACLPGT